MDQKKFFEVCLSRVRITTLFISHILHESCYYCMALLLFALRDSDNDVLCDVLCALDHKRYIGSFVDSSCIQRSLFSPQVIGRFIEHREYINQRSICRGGSVWY